MQVPEESDFVLLPVDPVHQPRETIEAICSFLNERLDPAMLDHTTLARRRIGPGGHVETRQPISAASVGRWRSEMTIFDQKMANRIAGQTLTKLGYQTAPQEEPLSMQERATLSLLTAKYRLVSAARMALTSLGLLTLNRGKRR